MVQAELCNNVNPLTTTEAITFPVLIHDGVSGLQRVRARFAVSSPVGPTPAYAGSPVRPPKRLFASLEEPHLSSAAAEGTQATWPLLRDRDACELVRSHSTRCLMVLCFLADNTQCGNSDGGRCVSIKAGGVVPSRSLIFIHFQWEIVLNITSTRCSGTPCAPSGTRVVSKNGRAQFLRRGAQRLAEIF